MQSFVDNSFEFKAFLNEEISRLKTTTFKTQTQQENSSQTIMIWQKKQTKIAVKIEMHFQRLS